MPIKERWPTTISVAALLRVSETRGIVLVKDKKTNGWGLPAGGINGKEYLLQGLCREISEESGLEPERLYFNRTPHIATILNPDKTQLGFVFRGTWSAPKKHLQKWKIRGDKDVSEARIFSLKDIFSLLEAPEAQLNKPQFNFAQLMRWVVIISHESSGAPVGYLNDWLEQMSRTIEGLSFHQDYLLEHSGWRYMPWYELAEERHNPSNRPRESYHGLLDR